MAYMVVRLKALFSSLAARLLVPLFLTVGVVLLVHALVSFGSIKDHFLALVGSEAQRSSSLIRRATHDGMLLNRLDEVQTTIERLAEGPEVAAIRVYDKKGEVVLSSDTSEIGVHIPVNSEPCTRCHQEGTPSDSVGTEAAEVIQAAGGEVLRRLTVIENEPACSAGGCHTEAAGHPVLGVLDVEMSTLPVQGAVRSARLHIVWTTLVLILVIGIVAAVMFRRLILQPVGRLQEGTRRIAGGDLETRIDVRGGHELARLAGDFNRMAEDLSRAQSELTQWSQNLEDKVAKKTEELRNAQRQVLHMEKMASLGKLSATVAHELNNPISGMLTYARLVERELAEQPLDPAVRGELERYLRLVQQECTRCGAIVKNLLVFARRTGAAMASVDLNEIVDRSLMLVQHRLDMSGTELRTTFLQGDANVVADPGQVQQALVALLVNAVEAMGDGGTLGVVLEGDAEGVRISVSDTGPGIPPDVLPLIFEPFFSTKDSESGVGLGLAVVYGIVHRHGGTIEVESEVGAGTTFHLRFPRIPPAARPEENAREGARAEAPPSPAHV
jgi:two-component system NtrC family sensor kinase